MVTRHSGPRIFKALLAYLADTSAASDAGAASDSGAATDASSTGVVHELLLESCQFRCAEMTWWSIGAGNAVLIARCNLLGLSLAGESSCLSKPVGPQ